MKTSVRKSNMRQILSVIFVLAAAAAAVVAEEDPLSLAQTLAKSGKYSEAALLFEKAVKDEPENEEIWRELGRCYRLAGDMKRAAESYGKAALLIPNDPYIHIDHARASDGMGDRVSAVDAYGRSAAAFAKVISAETNAAKKRVLYKDLGNVYFDMEQFTKAEEAFKDAIKTDPSYALGYNNLAAVYLRFQKYAQAVSALTTAYDLAPEDPRPLLNLILVNAYLKDAKRCEAYAAKAAAMKVPYPQFIHLYLAVLYAGIGDKAAWVKNLTEAFVLDKKKPAIDQREDIASEHGFDAVRTDADFIALVKSRFGQ